MRDNILAAAFLLASFLDVPLPGEEEEIASETKGCAWYLLSFHALRE